MADNAMRRLVAAVDIGTSKVAVLVGEVSEDGNVTIIGEGTHPCTGLSKGVVTNVDLTVESIKAAVAKASQMAVCDIEGVYVGVAGSHIRSHNAYGKVAIHGGEVTQEDVDRVMQSARTFNLSENEKILHVLPQEYVIDNHDGIREPIGMAGVSLEAHAHIITGAINAIRNIETCIKRANLQVDDLVLEQLASSYSTLTDDEKELGVCLVDIGGGTTDIAVFRDGAIRHTAVIPIAGDQVTKDIATAFCTTRQAAIQIKERFGCALPTIVNEDEIVEIPGVGGRGPASVKRATMSEVIEKRYEELFAFILEELRRSKFEDMLGAGVVLTGGSSKIHGARELAEEVFQKPVRIGSPRNVYGLEDKTANPIYATGVGLLMQAAKDLMEHGGSGRYRDDSLMNRILRWFKGGF